MTNDLDQLTSLLLASQRTLLQDLAAEIDSEKVSWGQIHLLQALEIEDKLTMSHIAKLMGHTTAAATGLVDRLETMGYVNRVHSTEDRRRVYCNITKKGSGLLNRVINRFRDRLDTTLAPLNATERQSLVRLLGKILQP
ncbi:MAG: MarR family winged helix-turn-helix transcriptional regulator [Verrucomicrobiales bacterium]